MSQNRRKYDLYYTLNTLIPKRAFSSAENSFFWKSMGKLDEAQSEAVILLIYEHFLVESKKETVDLQMLQALPYDGRQRKKTVSFRAESLPCALKWILYKFFEVIYAKQITR